MDDSISPYAIHTALDCSDAPALADFYARLLGWTTRPFGDGDQWIDVVPPDGHVAGLIISCQQIEDYRRPTWPTGSVPQQVHLDFHVDSIEAATPIAERAGAVRHPHQPGEDGGNAEDGRFVVFLDPEGHPFCLCEA